MKDIYINSRLAPLLLARRLGRMPIDWVFSQGEPWLLLTPPRLGRLSDQLGRKDCRIHRLLGLVRRYAADPGAYCRRLGVRATRRFEPAAYPLALCPRCDGAHHPHPEDAGVVCPGCREQERRNERGRPGGGQLLDRLRDGQARQAIMEKDAQAFDDGVLCPNNQYNRSRKLVRDWDAAVNRIMHGCTYRKVAEEFDCSVGLLHRKVMERKYWENN